MFKPYLSSLIVLFSLLGYFLSGVAFAQSTPPNIFEADTSKAHCRTEFPSQETMIKELQVAQQAAPLISTGVGGLRLENQNERLIRAYQMLVSEKVYSNGYLAVKKDLDLWSIFKDGSCTDTICAAQKFFGSEKGTIYLYVAWKYGLVMTHLGYDKIKAPSPEQELERKAYFTSRDWELSELRPYLRAIAMLPPTSYPLPWTRFNMAGIINPINPQIYSNGTILFYTPAESLTENQKEYTAYHEIAHVFGGATGTSVSRQWLQASGWTITENKKIIATRLSEFVSLYSRQNLIEDFAETYAFYRYAPDILAEKSPLRYEFMKTYVYFGKEYLQDCK